MPDIQVSDAEKERLLAEIGVEPSSIMIRVNPAALAPPPAASAPALPAPEVAPVPATRALAARPIEPAPPPPAPSRFWIHRRLIAGTVMLAAGSAWTAMWMASGRPAAAGLAALGLGAGIWLSLRQKNS